LPRESSERTNRRTPSQRPANSVTYRRLGGACEAVTTGTQAGYQHTALYQLTRSFLEPPERFLRHLFTDDEASTCSSSSPADLA
jgi:hypothetical protein